MAGSWSLKNRRDWCCSDTVSRGLSRLAARRRRGATSVWVMARCGQTRSTVWTRGTRPQEVRRNRCGQTRSTVWTRGGRAAELPRPVGAARPDPRCGLEVQGLREHTSIRCGQTRSTVWTRGKVGRRSRRVWCGQTRSTVWTRGGPPDRCASPRCGQTRSTVWTRGVPDEEEPAA